MEKLIVIIPTFNEPELLEQTIKSLEAPKDAIMQVLVVNAGNPLPVDLASKVTEITVNKTLYWTGQIQAGMDASATLNPDWIMFLNADTHMTAGSVQLLLDFARRYPDRVACCPAYEENDAGELRLIYSHQVDWGILLFGKLMKPWSTTSQAPTEPFKVDLTGGQGTMFSAELLKQFRLDPENCPHYGGDHDFWLTLRKGGHDLWLVPKAGIVNARQFGGMLHSSALEKVKGLWKRFSNRLYPESAGLMWRFRKKRMPLPLAIISFIVAFGLRWTLGLPKILKRL